MCIRLRIRIRAYAVYTYMCDVLFQYVEHMVLRLG